MNLNRSNCEKCLVETMEQCIREGINTPEALLSSPLYRQLMLTMGCWAELIGLPPHRELIRNLWEEPAGFAADWLVRFWDKGKKMEAPYCRLRSLLNFAHAHGSRMVPRYLMRCVRNYCIDRIDEYEAGECRVGPFTRMGVGGMIEEIMPSEAPDPNCEDVEQEVIHRAEMERFIRRLGGDLLQDLGMLSRALPIKRHQMAVMIFAGQQVALCREVVCLISGVLRWNYGAAWEPFLTAAENFRLPACMTSVETLERHMYRRTTARGCQEFSRRVGGRPA